MTDIHHVTTIGLDDDDSLKPNIIATAAYHLATINAQLKDCDVLLILCERLAQAENQVTIATSRLKDAEQNFRNEYEKQIQDARKVLHDAQLEYSDLLDRINNNRTNLQICQNRSNLLTAGKFTEADSIRIAAAVDSVQQAHNIGMLQLEKELNATQQQLNAFQNEFRDAQLEKSNVTEALEYFERAEIPPLLKSIIAQVEKEAEATHALQVADIKRRIDGFLGAKISKENELKDTIHSIKEMQGKIAEFEQACSDGILSRIKSGAWWGSLVTDFKKKLQSASDRKMSLMQELTELSGHINDAQLKHDEIVSAKHAMISMAATAEKDRQHEIFRQHAMDIKQNLARLEDSISGARDNIVGIEALISTASGKRQSDSESAEAKEKSAILEEAKHKLQESDALLQETESLERAAKEKLSVSETRLEMLSNWYSVNLDERLAEIKSAESQAVAALQEVETTISRHISNSGLDISPPFSRESAQHVKDALLRQVLEMTGRGPLPLSQPKSCPIIQPGSRPVFAQGNLYLDIDKNRDDNVDSKGNSYIGLRRQLSELRRRHSNTVFPNLPSDADILTVFRETFFPHGMLQTYSVSNLSLDDNKPYLAIRPTYIGPRLEKVLPRGMTLAICARLYNSRDPNNPVLLVQRIVDLPNSGGRHFELDISATVFYQSPPKQQSQNVLTTDFISSLPAISVHTKERLQEWRAYLDWKERLVQAKLIGLRYLKVDITTEGIYRFLVVTGSKEAFDRTRRTFKNDDLRTFGLGYSLDPWEFKYDPSYRGRDTVQLGRYERCEELNAPADVDTDVMPWDSPYFAYVYFRMDEDVQNEYDALLQEGIDQESAAVQFRGLLQPRGFLSLTVIGDMSLIKRQKYELDALQLQSGYAPFLSSYLFDISSAIEPGELVTITEDQWSRNDLNDDQKLAVRKIISTPDLGMVQGPPGTGKTTMIAEATWQFVRRGKKVLLVSQANLAVDNALERLAQVPAIRAIRLGRKAEESLTCNLKNVLASFYNAIAETCRSRTLDTWQKSDDRCTVLRKWLEDVDLLSSDIANLQQAESEVIREISDLQAERAKLLSVDEQSREMTRLRRDVETFRGLLEEDIPWSGELPERVLQTFYDSIVKPIDSLLGVGIRLNRTWPDYSYGQCIEKSAFAAEILREWRNLQEALPQIRGDLERLRASKEDSVLSSKDAIELQDLERRRQKAIEAMEEDIQMPSEVQALQKQIREIKRRGSGLNRNIYERIFNMVVDDRPTHLLFTDPNAKREQVVSELEKTLLAIQDVQERVNQGKSLVVVEIENYTHELRVENLDLTRIQRIEGRLRDAQYQANDLITQRTNKESCRRDLLSQQAHQEDSISDEYRQVRENVAAQLQQLEKQLNQTQSFRDAWEPILQQWVLDLTRAETVSNDQDNFLPTYMRSCNVVGVTCTENRKTLENAGHTYFDVVIIDEVSKATPTEIIMPLMMARTAILVGDHRQLPPLFTESESSWEEIVVAQEEATELNPSSSAASELTAENFERFRKMVTASLFKEHFENAPESLKSFLNTQYRMHPQIMSVINQFYENRLECGLSDPDAKQRNSDPRGHRNHGMTLVNCQKQQYVTPEKHVVWFDSTTDPLQQKHYERQAGSTGKANVLEAILIAKCLIDIELACREQGYGSSLKKAKQVGVITFYRGQVREIRNTVMRLLNLENIVLTAIRYDINTVDRYQGQERPIVIVSMVRNPPRKLSPRANTAQFERINVAFSRAQELLIIVGAKDVFCRYPVDLPYLDRPGRRKVEVYRYIIDEIQRNAGFWGAGDIIEPQDYSRFLTKEQTGLVNPRQIRARS